MRATRSDWLASIAAKFRMIPKARIAGSGVRRAYLFHHVTEFLRLVWKATPDYAQQVGR